MSYQKFLILDFQVQRIQAHGSESANYELISQTFMSKMCSKHITKRKN